MLTGLLVLLAVAVCGIVRADLTRTEVRDAISAVSVELFKSVSAESLENRVLSPVSVGILLALLDQGASGETSQQLQTALRLKSHQQLKEAYGSLSEGLQMSGKADDVQLDVANRIFISEGFPVQEEFLQVATRDFYSGVENVTFGTGKASDAINTWVAEATHGKITNIVEPVLPAATAMVLANAVYFKSPWMKPFKKALTQERSFSVNPEKNVTVAFMYQENSFQIGSDENLGVKWVEIPFQGGNYSLMVVLPNENFGLADVLANLTSTHLTKMLEESTWKGVKLCLPRFKIGSKSKLVPALKGLGITYLFEKGRSDLSGISSSKEPLSVSDVRQTATLEIDEKGGVAAAATVVEIVALSSVTFFETEEFYADHPFFAAIVDRNRDVPLFMSTVIDPSVG